MRRRVVDICGKSWELREYRRRWRSGIDGECWMGPREILVHRTGDREYDLDTLAHEVAHAVEAETGKALGHRLIYKLLEEGYGPRCECQDKGAVCGCYMYRPVKGVVLRSDKGDRRPLGGPAFIAARAHGIGLSPGAWTMHKVKGGYATYWEAPSDKQQA